MENMSSILPTSIDGTELPLRETNTRDHDSGTESKNEKPFNFPYVFPNQLVQSV